MAYYFAFHRTNLNFDFFISLQFRLPTVMDTTGCVRPTIKDSFAAWSTGGSGRGGPVVRVALPDGGEDPAVQQRAGGRRRDRTGRGVPGVGGRGTGADGPRGGGGV